MEKRLDVRATSQVDLIARAMRINGELWAQRVEAIAGANSVSYADDSATPMRGVGAPPALAIDVAALGGMYANAVHLIGTERGVGSNVGGTLNSLTGDIRLSSNGELTIVPGGALLAAQNGNVSAPSITNAGTIATNGSVALLASNSARQYGHDHRARGCDGQRGNDHEQRHRRGRHRYGGRRERRGRTSRLPRAARLPIMASCKAGSRSRFRPQARICRAARCVAVSASRSPSRAT